MMLPLQYICHRVVARIPLHCSQTRWTNHNEFFAIFPQWGFLVSTSPHSFIYRHLYPSLWNLEYGIGKQDLRWAAKTWILIPNSSPNATGNISYANKGKTNSKANDLCLFWVALCKVSTYPGPPVLKIFLSLFPWCSLSLVCKTFTVELPTGASFPRLTDSVFWPIVDLFRLLHILQKEVSLMRDGSYTYLWV